MSITHHARLQLSKPYDKLALLFARNINRYKMYLKIQPLLILSFIPILTFGITTPANESSSVIRLNQTESPIFLSADEVQILKNLVEKQKMESSLGTTGSSPANKTISATGDSIEETQTGPQTFIFWTQTLANGLYYEAQFYAKYNMRTQNPAFPNVPASAVNNPPGFKGVLLLGYNFHVLPDYDITPYLRLERGSNITIVYEDSNGDYINSTDNAVLIGFKQAFKLLHNVTPYINIWGGLVHSKLNGVMNQSVNTNNIITAQVNQWQLITEFGFAYKITEHQSIIPGMRNIYTTNSPDNTAALPYNQGGFNISQLSSSQQVYIIKYLYSF